MINSMNQKICSYQRYVANYYNFSTRRYDSYSYGGYYDCTATTLGQLTTRFVNFPTTLLSTSFINYIISLPASISENTVLYAWSMVTSAAKAYNTGFTYDGVADTKHDIYKVFPAIFPGDGDKAVTTAFGVLGGYTPVSMMLNYLPTIIEYVARKFDQDGLGIKSIEIAGSATLNSVSLANVSLAMPSNNPLIISLVPDFFFRMLCGVRPGPTSFRPVPMIIAGTVSAAGKQSTQILLCPFALM